MGRVNFDKSIHDRKGITEKVELVNGKNAETLKGWTVYNLPVDYEFVSSGKWVRYRILPQPWSNFSIGWISSVCFGSDRLSTNGAI